MPRARHTAVRLLLAAVVLSAVGALGLDYASRRLFGTIGAVVHVRWAPEIGAVRREALESRFCLTGREPLSGETFSYLLVDTSGSNIRALVTHPDVPDTHDLDRSAFEVAGGAERVFVGTRLGERRLLTAAAASRLLWYGAAMLAVLALLSFTAPGRISWVVTTAWTAAGRLWGVLYSRIPEVSAEGAAAFRIVFGAAVVIVFTQMLEPASVAPEAQPDRLPSLMRAAGRAFVTSPHYADWIGPWMAITGALFVAGAWTRLSFAAFTLGAIAWGVVYSMHSGHHPVSAMLVALICLLPSNWGDAWSVDALLGRRRGGAVVSGSSRDGIDVVSGFSQTDPREYGYTAWIPGVVLGIALAAAAASKLNEGGIGWILNGTVKYHFVTDAANAPVDWGVRYAVVPGVAIALSFGAIAIESLVVVAALFGPPWARLLAAAAVIPMLTGFWLFQGVFWPSWWVLLLSFAPWHRLRPAHGASQHVPRRGLRLRHVQAAVLVAAAGQQIAASVWHLEEPPIVSAYDMYSKTYDDPGDYPADGGVTHWLVAEMADGGERACRLDRDDAATLAGLSPSEYTSRAGQVLASCVGDIGSIRAVAVEERRPEIDWAAGRYIGTSRVRLSGPVTLD